MKIRKLMQTDIGIGQVASGLPDFKIPPFEIDIKDGDNGFFRTLYFGDLIAYVGSTILALPLISILESIAVAKAFCKFCKSFWNFWLLSIQLKTSIFSFSFM